MAGNNPTLYAYVSNSNWWIDPFGLINLSNLTNDELLDKIWELAYRNKRLFNNSGTHGVVHRIREQITGKMRPPMSGWYTHDDQITAGLNNLRDALNEAKARGLADQVNDLNPDINKVVVLDPPKPTDTEVPKICR